ncbi:receptor activity-modifying protein 2 isoform X2 [Sphaeramia orbicularis]|uniref:Receptor (G protein-coupled) activity modifying protein 2 n=1 Tax=Sphaeramia orbicularis TaxID=375764 RepID=A0A673BHF8_9TELE|nr:receptor activity-modifying protein 2 isoform X2 [Sphaeramia orbicularis]
MTGKMTTRHFSFLLSRCFISFLILVGHTTVLCLVDEKLAVHPTTTVAYHFTDMMNGTTNASAGEDILPFDCGNNSHNCKNFCHLCYEFYQGPTMDCLSGLLNLCLHTFDVEMAQNSTNWCIWGNVSGSYSNLSLCTEEISDCLLIPWPNPLVEQIFVDIHTKFFKDCPTEELSDPPPVIIFALVITPICLIPVMVSLVVLKTKNGDGST